jgi:hypothetical protein
VRKSGISFPFDDEPSDVEVELADHTRYVGAERHACPAVVEQRDWILLRDQLALVDDELDHSSRRTGQQLVHDQPPSFASAPASTRYGTGVVLFVGTVVLVVAVMLLTNGSWRRLGEIHLRSLWLLFVALGVQLVLEFVDFSPDRIDDVGLGLTPPVEAAVDVGSRTRNDSNVTSAASIWPVSS